MSLTIGRLVSLAHGGDDPGPGRPSPPAPPTTTSAPLATTRPTARRRPMAEHRSRQPPSVPPRRPILFEGGAEFVGNFALAARVDGRPGQPDHVGSYGRGRAVIRAGRGTGIRVEDLGGVVIRDLVVVGDLRDGNEGFGVLVLHRRPDETRLEGIRIEGVEARGFRWAGIYVGGVPTNLPGFEAPEGSRHGFRDVRIRDCTARENTYYGIYVDGAGKGAGTDYANRDVAIAECVAADNPGDPQYADNHSGNGILLADTDGGLIEHCVAHGNGEANAGRTGGPVGIWTYASNRVTIQSCESYGNRTGGQADGGGFDLDGGVTNSVIQYCYSHDNDGPGFLVWNYAAAPHRLADNVIRYNISAGDGRKHGYGGISVGTSDAPVRNLSVHNNTVYATRTPRRRTVLRPRLGAIRRGYSVRQQPLRHRRGRAGGRLRGARRGGPLPGQRLLGRRRRVPRPARRPLRRPRRVARGEGPGAMARQGPGPPRRSRG